MVWFAPVLFVSRFGVSEKYLIRGGGIVCLMIYLGSPPSNFMSLFYLLYRLRMPTVVQAVVGVGEEGWE